MRVLMLGWDFSPRLSGGVGSACQGIANALARAPESIRAEILFVLPRVRGDEEPESVKLLLAGDTAASTASRPGETTSTGEIARAAVPRARALTAAARIPVERAGPPAPEPRPERPEPAPALPSAAEALRLLEIDSPLRPYLSPQDYAEVVSRLLARIRRAPPAPSPKPVPPPKPVPRPRAAARESRPASLAPADEPAPLPASIDPVRIPPYGQTLVAEVERYARAALALVEHETFDVIHAHDWMTFPAGMLLAERTGKPLLLHFHSCEAERRGPLGASDVRAIEQAAITAAQRVLCVSEASARTLRAHYAIEYAKVRVLHNAFAPLAPAVPRAERDEAVVLYLGRLSEQKAPDVFLRAAAHVVEHTPSASFVLAGAGELYPELEALAGELGLAERVRFTGFVSGEELARTYADADVYVLSSAAEPFGISALEALSLGVPTIVPHGAGVTEVVRSVLRFEPGDELDLADKIVALLERRALWRQLSAAGLREVKKVRWDRPARALRGIYDEVVV